MSYFPFMPLKFIGLISLGVIKLNVQSVSLSPFHFIILGNNIE